MQNLGDQLKNDCVLGLSLSRAERPARGGRAEGPEAKVGRRECPWEADAIG